MGIFNFIRNYFNRKFRVHYENRINLQYGILQFIANFCALQFGPDEYIKLRPASLSMHQITVTPVGGRPKLHYSYWPRGMEYRPDFPEVEVIVEEKKLQVKNASDPEAKWEVVSIDDERVNPLKDIFLASAFYPVMHAEQKRKISG